MLKTEDNRTNLSGFPSSTSQKETNNEKLSKKKPGGWKAMPFILGILFLPTFLIIVLKLFMHIKKINIFY